MALLKESGLDQARIADVIDSGYYLRNWSNPAPGHGRVTVSDSMYGNKQLSSSLDTERFLAYVKGRNTFSSLPQILEYTARSRADIEQILSDQRRAFYLEEGTLTFRGQVKQHTFRRKVPNPIRSDSSGDEISVFPGIYRQDNQYYSFSQPIDDNRTMWSLLHQLEPSNPEAYIDGAYSHDVMRAEQHYANQTSGLDVAFDVDVAIFFATHRFEWTEDGRARYSRVPTGDHEGAIYCFRFRDPSVKKTEFLIREFDLFKTYRPERILRQKCGLPLIGDYERNIALCDIDCIIKLDESFKSDRGQQPLELFPPVSVDTFYARLLELKDQYPGELGKVVEYEWGRQ